MFSPEAFRCSKDSFLTLSVAKVFNRSDPRPAPPPPQAAQHGKVLRERQPAANSEAFAAAASALLRKKKSAATARYKGLEAWQKARG